jgi:hypothetical protein
MYQWTKNQLTDATLPEKRWGPTGLLFFLLVTGMLLVAGQVLLADTLDTTIECQVPLAVTCTLTNPQGIANVKVQVQTSLGPVFVVDQNFDCLAEVTVGWDPIVPNAEFFVTDCDSGTPPGMVPTGAFFAGLMHYPLSPAQLNLSEDGILVARGMGNSGDGGVFIDVGRARAWEALMRFQAANNATLRLTAFGEQNGHNQAAATLSLMETAAGMSFAARFGSPTYNIQIYEADELVFQAADVPSGTQAITVPEWICDAFDEILLCGPSDLVFRVLPQTEECEWEIVLATSFDIETGEGLVIGNRIVMTEVHPPHEHLEESGPMVFTAMSVKTAQIPAFEIYTEDTVQDDSLRHIYLPIVLNSSGD